MGAAYWKGLAAGLLACVVLGAGVQAWLASGPSLPTTEALVFDPPLVSALDQWILPGQSRSFTVQLHNRGREPAVIEELRFSCPCAAGRIGENQRLPISIPGGRSLPVEFTITSLRGERGRVELRYGVIGRVGKERVAPGALAEVEFAQVLNADPPLVTFGAIRRDAPPRTETVEIWSPRGDVPIQSITVESDDPAVKGEFEPQSLDVPGPSPLSSHKPCVPLGRLKIVLEPRIVPERLKADVVVRSGDHDVRVPVLGLVDSSPATEVLARD
jgi:hypothetical protein